MRRKTVYKIMGSLFVVGAFFIESSRIETGIAIIIMLLFFILAEVLEED